ncbi:MAG: OmpA family protein [Ignavibacteria bacterium]|nr:OmpA family protein [Ignavibacteria bacterium]
MKYSLLVFLFVLSINNSRAQTAPKVDTLQFLRYGAYINGGMDIHHANFARFNDVAFCCPDNFSDVSLQSGIGLGIGGLLEFPLSADNKWIMDLRLGVQYHTATLSQQQSTIFNDNLNGNIAINGSFDYTISSKTANASLLVMPGYRITNRMSFMVGLKTDYLFLKSFSQAETVTSPSNAFFYNTSDASYSKERNTISGDIPSVNELQLSGIAGLSYEIAANLNGSTLISPEVFYSFGITSLSSALRNEGSWRMSGLYAGVALRYSITPTVFAENNCPQCYIPVLEGNDCIPVLTCKDDQQLKLNAVTNKCECISTVTLAEIDSVIGTFTNGTSAKFPALEVTVQQFRRTVLKPLLPYLFYFASASEISDSYSFIDPALRDMYKIDKTIAKVKSKPLALYNDILNIVGKRMSNTPDAILTITGYHDGVEANGKEIANDRALIVKKYFQDTWKLSDERLVVVAGDLPTKPTTINGSTTDEKARQENRRVELSSNNQSLFDPISMVELEREVEPDRLTYYSTVKSPFALTGGYFELKQSAEGQNSQLFIKKENFAELVPHKFEFSWKTITNLPTSQGDLYYDFVVSNAKGVIPRTATTLNLKVKQVSPEEKERLKIADKFVDIFEVILFDINSTDLSAANKQTLESVTQKITPKSIIRVIGYTDNTGTDEYNKSLSIKRAESIAALLPKDKIVEVRGDGVSNAYKNELPEGRNYNRTVRIIIETDNRK